VLHSRCLHCIQDCRVLDGALLNSIFGLESFVGILVVCFSIVLHKGRIKGFGDGLESVVDLSTDGEGGCAVVGFAGFAEFSAAGGFAIGAGEALMLVWFHFKGLRPLRTSSILKRG
jgi:hypothetical protein